MGFEFRSLFKDSFSSLMTGLGIPGRDKSQSMIPVIDNVAFDLKHLEALYRGNWIAKKIVDIPAFDATRAWRTWNAEKDQIQKIEETERKFGIQRKVLQALIKSRLYGGAGLVLGVKGSLLNRELKIDDVGEGDLQWVHVVERWMLQAGPLVRDITSPWFGEPSYYMRSNMATVPAPGNVDPIKASSLGYQPGETIWIHPSRVVRLVGTEYPDMELAPDSWGDSVLTNVYEAIRDAGLVTASLANMIADAKVDVFKIPGLTTTLATTEGTNKMLSYLSNANAAKSVINSLVLDKEIEWERIETKFEGLDKVLQAYLLIAAAGADIPSTRLLSREPAGMNASGDSDTRNYYDRVAADQTVRMTPLLNRLDEVLLRHTFGQRDDEWNYTWNPLWQMTATEKAAIALQKAQAYQIDVNSALIPAEALVKGRENQLIEDDTYPGLDVALDDLEKNWEEEVAFLPHQQMEQEDDHFSTTQENFKAAAAAGGNDPKGGPGKPGGKPGAAKPKPKAAAKDAAARRLLLMDRYLYGDVDFTQGEGGRFTGSIGHGGSHSSSQRQGELHLSGGGSNEMPPHEVVEAASDINNVMQGRLGSAKYAFYAKEAKVHRYERSIREHRMNENRIIAAYHANGAKAKAFMHETVSHTVLRHVVDSFRKAAVGLHVIGLAEDVTINHVLLPVLEVGLVACLAELGAPVVLAGVGVEVAHYAAQYMVEHSPLSQEHAYAVLGHACSALLGAWQHFKAHDSLWLDQDYDSMILALQRLQEALADSGMDEDITLDDEQSALSFQTVKEGARKRRRPFKVARPALDAAPRTLYVRRDVLNAGAIIAWAKAHGFKTTLPADEMHVTVCYSKTPVDWMRATNSYGEGELTILAGGARMLDRFGPDKDCVVLLFNSDSLQWSHEDFKRIGAVWSWDEYQPHITISYKVPATVDLDKIEPYRGEIKLGPEIFEQIKTGWHSGIQEDADVDFTQGEGGRFTGSVGHGGGGSGGNKYGLVPGDVEKYHALKNEWAQVNNGLLAHVDKPDGPEARAMLNKLEGIVKNMQTLHADPGGPAGIGLPGGPRDVVIVGAGPGGLAASINGAAEGLDTLVIEANAVAGGQAKFSSRIENFPGFPVGVTGQRLTQDMFEQATRLGAEATLGTRVTAMTYDAATGLKHLTLSNGQHVDSRTVILAGGVEFRHLAFPGSEGSNVIVGDGKALAVAGAGGAVVVIGGSNGAAQAALGAAPTAKHVYLLARHPVVNSMSDYQISALKNNPKITVIESDSIAKLFRDEHGTPTSMDTVKGQHLPVKAIGEFLGSVPDARWLPSNIPLAKGGRVTTNAVLETPIPGVYAIGDMKDGAIGRVGVAVGEGQFALREANMFLAKQKKATTDARTFNAAFKDAIEQDLITRLFDLDRENPWFGQTVEGVSPLEKTHRRHDAEYVEEQHPRGDHGRWGVGSGTAAQEFVSPNTTQLSFPQAMSAIGSQHHQMFKEAAEQVDAATNSYATERSVIGAWSDGAEDSTMMVTPKINHDDLMLNAAIKGALGRQKSVLVFDDNEKGPHQLYHIQLPGQTLTDAHNALLKAGVEFHTLLPREHGAEAIVVDMDGSMKGKLEALGEKFGASGVVYNGTAQFIGTTKEDGSDEEQRADAVKRYESIIASSPSNKRGIWSGLHHRWAARLKNTEYSKRTLVGA